MKKINQLILKREYFDEQLQNICLNLEVLSTSTEIFIFTSSTQAEGKTYVSYELAKYMASTNKRILLIDADTRKNGLTSILNLLQTDGLINYLTGSKINIQNLTTNLDYISSGNSITRLNIKISEYGNKLDQFFTKIGQLKDNYDYIFIDTPPVLIFNDSRILAKYSDKVILVSRKNKTLYKDLKKVTNILSKDNITIAGVINNFASFDSRDINDYNYY